MSLRREFWRARDEADAAATRLTGPSPGVEPGICRYCGRFWRQWAGSRLDGHSKCIVPEWFKRTVREYVDQHPLAPYQELADLLQVSVSVVRSWVSPISQGPR